MIEKIIQNMEACINDRRENDRMLMKLVNHERESQKLE
jgi:hypothetical protein